MHRGDNVACPQEKCAGTHPKVRAATSRRRPSAIVLLHQINVIGKLHPETAAVAADIAPLVTEISNNVEALLRQLRAPIRLEHSGSNVQLCITACDQHIIFVVAHALEVGSSDVCHDMAAAGEKCDAIAALEEHSVTGCSVTELNWRLMGKLMKSEAEMERRAEDGTHVARVWLIAGAEPV
jgi:hypothetical protein